ncbi:MAG: hypothetical protein K0U15_05545 [Proteobacteria bacterium]|nr:hypothetical protein [Pseudomonadota bacterium]
MKRLILVAVDAESELVARQIGADFCAFLSATGRGAAPALSTIRATTTIAPVAEAETIVLWVLCYRHTAENYLDINTLPQHSGCCLMVNVDLNFSFHAALQKRAQTWLGKECQIIEVPKLTASETQMKAVWQRLATCLNWQTENATAKPQGSATARAVFESSIDVLRVATLLNFPLTQMYDTLAQTFTTTVTLSPPQSKPAEIIYQQLQTLFAESQELQESQAPEVLRNQRCFAVVSLLLCCANAREQKRVNIECYHAICEMIDAGLEELRPLQQFVMILLAECYRQEKPTQAYEQLQQLGEQRNEVKAGGLLLEATRLLVLLQVLDTLGQWQEKEQCAEQLARLVEKLSSEELTAIGVQSFAKIRRLRKTIGDIL